MSIIFQILLSVAAGYVLTGILSRLIKGILRSSNAPHLTALWHRLVTCRKGCREVGPKVYRRELLSRVPLPGLAGSPVSCHYDLRMRCTRCE